MKALSLSRPLLIMIIGLPGAGKSFFAGHFADTFGAPLVSADVLRHELFESPSFTMAEMGLIKRMAEIQLVELVKTRTTIVVDGLSNSRKERQQFEQFATAHRYGTLIVWVQTDEPTSKARSISRNTRPVDDKYSKKLTLEQFKQLAANLNTPVKQEDYVVISGKHTYTTQAKMVLRKLSAPHTQKAESAHQQRGVTARPQTPPNRRNVLIR